MSGYFLGAIDEFAVFDRALSQEEIQAIIAEGHDCLVEPFLSFPLANRDPYSAKITSVFDHSMTNECPATGDPWYRTDGAVTAFTGEQGTATYEADSLGEIFGGCGTVYGYQQDTEGTPFDVNGEYTGGGDDKFLYYEGHPGYDYSSNGEDVLAAAPGIVDCVDVCDGGQGAVRIDHGNGFTTTYLHLSSRTVGPTDEVGRGDPIGVSGSTGTSAPHLHFEVRKDVDGTRIPVDPYGWQGAGPDPYQPHATNQNLWLPVSGGAPFFAEDFDVAVIDTEKWNTSIATSGVRFCSPSDSAFDPNGVWQEVSTIPCYGSTAPAPYGFASVDAGVLSVGSSSGHTYPYIWAGPPSRESPFPGTGDFTFSVRMKYSQITNKGVGFAAKRWENTDPVGNNPTPDDPALLSVWSDSSGLRAFLFEDPVSVTDALSFHDYRVECIDGTYSLFVDDVLRLGPTAGGLRPNSILLGNVIFAHGAGGTDWGDFQIDSIVVSSE